MAVCRLRRVREQHGLDVVLDMRAWPLELINRQGTPHNIVTAEISLLGSHEPDLFTRYDGDSWPSAFLPAFELVAAARRVGGLPAAEAVDWAVRMRFFREAADVSMLHELRQAVEDADLDVDAIWHAFTHEPVRADVLADYERSKDLPIEGSPQIFWPDGSSTHNPGFTMEFERGLPRIRRADPDEPGRLLLDSIERVRRGAERPAVGGDQDQKGNRAGASGR